MSSAGVVCSFSATEQSLKNELPEATNGIVSTVCAKASQHNTIIITKSHRFFMVGLSHLAVQQDCDPTHSTASALGKAGSHMAFAKNVAKVTQITAQFFFARHISCTMIIAYCKNCGKATGHKRTIGVGTLLGGALTGGISILAVPLYPKRCVVCGLSTSEGEQVSTPSSPASSSQVTKADKFQGWIVLVGVVALFGYLFAFAQHCSDATPASSQDKATVTNTKQSPTKQSPRKMPPKQPR